MKVIIGSTTYTALKGLSFTPQIDITGDSVPVNEFSVQIQTQDNIDVGQWASLYDDLDNLWAKFWIMYADRVDAKFVSIKAQSIIALLDRVTMQAEMYTSNTSASTIISACFSAAGIGSSVQVDSTLSSATIIGHLPEQTARERLQWVCFAIGAYVQQDSVAIVQIKKLDTLTLTDIPIDKTFWKPSIEYKDYVTKINITAYSFAQGTPAHGDEYVTVNDIDYIITKTTITLTNSGAPETALPNEINIDGVYLVNNNNADEIASRLSMLYFARRDVSADVINNHEYFPSQKVSIQLDDTHGAVGYIESADFRFGLQARSTLRLVASETRELVELLIRYTFNGEVIGTRRYAFPQGYTYSILNPFITRSSGNHRYVYRPLTEYCSGTMGQGATQRTVACEMALHWYEEYKLLRVLSVSDVEFDDEDKVVEIK